MKSLNVFHGERNSCKNVCFDKCIVYLVNLDQRNLLKRKGMSYIVKQHLYAMKRMQGK